MKESQEQSLLILLSQLKADMDHSSSEENMDLASDSSEREDRRHSKHHQTDFLIVIQVAGTHVCEEVDYRIYWTENRSAKCNDTVLKNEKKMVKRMNAEIKYHIINPFDYISIIVIIVTFGLAGDTNGIFERTAIQLLNM